MILLFRETSFLMIFLIFSVTSFRIYFFRQKDAKMDPKSDQNGTTNHPDAEFLRFWSVLGGGVFSTFLGTGKSRPKIWKKQPAELNKIIPGYLLGGPAECAGCRRGKERFRTSPGSARILARNLKPRILGFGILGPGKNLAGT
jgi:hypothetical protein